MKYCFLFIAIIFTTSAFAQASTKDSNLVCWSKYRRLEVADFQMKVAPQVNSYSSSQFSYDYKVVSLFVLPKDYKKNISNCFVKNASWINTSKNTDTTLRYQQTLFDLGEVYVRQFRKFVFDNRKKLAFGKVNADDANSEIMNNLAKRKAEYNTDTSFGTNPEKQRAWEITIFKELEALKDFSVE
jgi:hypothetical protein